MALRFFVAAVALAFSMSQSAPVLIDAQTPRPPAPGDPPQVEVVATPAPVVRPTATAGGDPLVRIVGVGGVTVDPLPYVDTPLP